MCQRMSPTVPDDLLGIRDQPFPLPTDVVNQTGKVYCIYNNSRFRKPRGHDFLPQHVPWWFCPNLVYWSVGVNDGRLKVRAPKFDHRYGLYKLRIVADAYRAGIELLMTIGGYPEDTGQLYRVGAGTARAQSLGKEVLETVRNAGLNGVNIHLVEDPPCEHFFKDQVDTIAAFVDTLAALVGQSFATTPFRMTMMIGTHSTLGREVSSSLLSRMDHVFIDTHSAVTTDITSLGAYCAQYDKMTETYLGQAHMSRSKKLCPSLSLHFPRKVAQIFKPNVFRACADQEARFLVATGFLRRKANRRGPE
ncbi:hypothetical protein HPB48_011708 [Haemaphysalis longicornis]|uniref:Uncharacterized protein n=1 Tax=Haemaphysalis longicornis TaxID=44386 RepID=A0A9J6H499_HAELO|nr:hypothetical protein HPB48_011708 [Haemaphysalis longicornis]